MHLHWIDPYMAGRYSTLNQKGLSFSKWVHRSSLNSFLIKTYPLKLLQISNIVGWNRSETFENPAACWLPFAQIYWSNIVRLKMIGKVGSFKTHFNYKFKKFVAL